MFAEGFFQTFVGPNETMQMDWIKYRSIKIVNWFFR